MPEEEKAQQLAKIEEIKAQLTDGTTKEEFMQLFTSYNNDAQATQRLGSYYFSEGNAYTTAYEKVFPSVSETALSLAIGEVGIATSSIGTHFIFRTEAGDAPYNDKNYQEFFEDFRTNAATYLYQQLLQEGLAGVKVKNQAFLDGLSFGDTQPNNSLMIAYFRHYQVSVSKKPT